MTFETQVKKSVEISVATKKTMAKSEKEYKNEFKKSSAALKRQKELIFKKEAYPCYSTPLKSSMCGTEAT